MKNFFSSESIFYKVTDKISTIVILNFLWIVFSLPLVTIGASTKALFKTSMNIEKNIDGYIFKDFVRFFKEDFMKVTVLWLCSVVYFAVSVYNVEFVNLYFSGPFKNLLLIFNIAFIMVGISFTIFLFPILAEYRGSAKEVFKTVLIVSLQYAYISLFCFILFLLLTASVLVFGVPILFYMGLYSYLVCKVMIKIFSRMDFPKQQ